MKRDLTHLLGIAVLLASAALAQPGAHDTAEARTLLERALVLEKAMGARDSAAAAYRGILDLHTRSRADAVTAQQARARLAALGFELPDAPRLAAASATPPAADRSAPAADPLAERRADLTGLAGSLQLGRTASTAPRGGSSRRLRWYERATRLQVNGPDARRESAVHDLGRAIARIRTSLGLRGLDHWIEMERRRARGRELTPHEHLLAALMAEKEQSNLYGAERRYRELVQLGDTGGIATRLHETGSLDEADRLTERARDGVERTERRRRAAPGSAWP